MFRKGQARRRTAFFASRLNHKRHKDKRETGYNLGAIAAVGAVIYIIYGFWHSKLAKGIDITEETTMSSPAEAMGSGVDNQKD